MSRRNQEQDFGDAPSFEEYATARRVMIYTRRQLEAEGTRVSFSGCPVFAHVVMQSSPLVDPTYFDTIPLLSAERGYDRGDDLHALHKRQLRNKE